MKTITLLSIAFLAFVSSWQKIGSHTDSAPYPSLLTENKTDNTLQTPSFEGVLVMQGLGGEATYYVKGDKVRSEIRDEGEEAIFLYSFSSASYTAIMPSEKIYMEAPVHQLNFSDKDMKEINDCESKIVKTGEKQTMRGIGCEKWVASCGKDRSEVWVTRELGFEWAQIFHPMYRAAYTGSMQQYGDMQGYFPMKMVAPDERGRMVVFMEVVRLDQKKLGDELFSVPAGYKKMGIE